MTPTMINKWRRKRGELDDDIWKSISIVHASLWGTSCVLFVTSFFGILKTTYSHYIEHVISNLNYLVYLGTIVALSIDGF